MATVTTPPMTAEEFGVWWCRNENCKLRFDLIDGSIRKSPYPPSNPNRLRICEILQHHVAERRGVSMSVLDDGLIVRRYPDTVLSPDIMLFTNSRSDDFTTRVTGQCPELVVEIATTTISPTKLLQRGEHYNKVANVPTVWLVLPHERAMLSYSRDGGFRALEENDELTGGAVLPKFRCKVADLFAMPGQKP